MILKGSARGNARALGRHLLNTRDNEIVEIHEVRGFNSRDVAGAMRELDAIASCTKSRQPIFSVSLSPPQDAEAGIDLYENAIRQIEEANGLTGQPRIIIFHEKEARRHCHCAWSRIDAETLTVKPVPFFKNKLNDIAKGIYLDQGWALPRGFIDRSQRDPRNFNLAEWQQCKRIGRDPRQLKLLAQESWAISEDAASFAEALEQRGLYLARGDRRDHVVMTVEGEAFAVPRLLAKRTKEVRERIGDIELPGVDAARSKIASIVMPKLRDLMARADAEKSEALAPLDARRAGLAARHRTERELTDAGLKARADAENALRASRLRSGIAGLWQRLSGEYRRLREENEREAWTALQRDREQRAALLSVQHRERAALQREIVKVRQDHTARLLELHRDLDRQRDARANLRTHTLRSSFSTAHDPEGRQEALRALVERSPTSRQIPRLPRDRRTEIEPDLGIEP